LSEAPRMRSSLVPRNRYLLVIALGTFVVGLLEAAGVIELPFGTWFSILSGSAFSSSTLGNFMQNYGYASLFALMALESASLPVPSEVVLPFAGYLVYLGLMNFWLAVLVSLAAGLTGALLDYYLARWLGRPFVLGILKLFRLHKSSLDRAEGWFRRSGEWTVFAARFIPGLRTVISLPAGLFEMELRPFVIMTAAGCFLWSVILVYAGFLAGTAGTTYSSAINSATVQDGIAAILAVTAGGYIAYYAYAGLKAPARPFTPSLVS
jgi:membrane protein DedA with SNARE-associated domain